MRASAIFPALCALAALVLSLLCLFAGSNKTFLQNAELLTVNASRFGHTSIFNTSDGSGGLLSSLANDVESEINDLVNNVTADIAKSLDIKDFYMAHILDFCEGYYEGNDTYKTKDPKKNVTYCSKKEALFHFDPTTIIQHELANGTNLTDLHWPSEIQKGVEAVEVASKVMFVFYCIGIAFSAIAFVTAIIGILANGRISAFLNWIVDILAFFSLGIASAIATTIIVKVTHAVNKYGAEIGIAAYKGKAFLGMTWAATAVMLLASFIWIFECIKGRSHKTTYSDKDTNRY